MAISRAQTPARTSQDWPRRTERFVNDWSFRFVELEVSFLIFLKEGATGGFYPKPFDLSNITITRELDVSSSGCSFELELFLRLKNRCLFAGTIGAVGGELSPNLGSKKEIRLGQHRSCPARPAGALRSAHRFGEGERSEIFERTHQISSAQRIPHAEVSWKLLLLLIFYPAICIRKEI